MKIKKLGNLVFFAVTLILFGAGTVFTAAHRWNTDALVFSRSNVLALAGGAFLTVGELAFIFMHAMLGSRETWRKAAAYVLAIGLCITIAYAACSEAIAFVNEGNVSFKAKTISEFSKDQQNNAKSKRAETAAVMASSRILKNTLEDVIAPDFTPFAINFFFGLFCIVTGTVIAPGEAWKRKRGNVMNDNIRAQAEKQIGYSLPQGATAYDDGKGSSVAVKNGRDYITTVSKKKIGFDV